MKKILIKFKNGSDAILNVMINDMHKVETAYNSRGKLLIQDSNKIPLYHIDFSDVICIKNMELNQENENN